MTRSTHAALARAFAALAALVCFGVAAARADDGGADKEPDLRPREVRGLNIQNTLGVQAPLDLVFTNVNGKQQPLRDFFGRPSGKQGVKKPVVLMMVYFRCPILCPMVLEKFTRTLNEIDYTVGSEYDAVVISFDGRDTPDDAATQRANQLLFYRQPTTDTIRDGWTFLTCQDHKDAPEKLAQAIGFEYRYIPAAQEFAHGAAVYILTPEGKVSRILTGLNYPASDVRLALLEASEGKIGSLFDRFTLWCYHFDPNAGVYVVAAMRVMQVGASAVAIVLGLFIFAMFRWERRKRGSRAPASAASAGDTAAIDAAGPPQHVVPLPGRSFRSRPDSSPNQPQPLHPSKIGLTGQAS